MEPDRAPASTPYAGGRDGRSRRARWRSLGTAAITAALPASAAMAAILMLVAEIAARPTAVPGIRSSTWTPLTAVSAFFLGPDAFHASFAVLPILFGLAVHLALSVALGVGGAALIVFTLGDRAGPLAAAALGLAYGLILQVVALNLVVNGVEADNLVYESLPQWGWWVAHAAFGATLGLALARVLPVAVPRPDHGPDGPETGAAVSAR